MPGHLCRLVLDFVNSSKQALEIDQNKRNRKLLRGLIAFVIAIGLCLALAMGRYVLLKMINPDENANADVEPASKSSQQIEPTFESSAVNSLVLSETALEIKVGTTTQLNTFGGTGEVVWTSSDEDVVTVENGEVKSISVGTAMVSATAGNETVSCTVTIKPRNPMCDKTYDANGALLGYEITCFDEFGRLANIATYDAEGNQTGYGNYIYDEEGNTIQKPSCARYITDGCAINYLLQIDGTITQEYDSEGRTISETMEYLDKTFGVVNTYHGYKSTYEYDSAGNEIRCDKIDYYSDGVIKSIYTYEYDSSGNQIRWNASESDERGGYSHEWSYTYTYEYNSSGNVVRDESYDGEMELFSYTIYEYDSVGRQTHVNRFNADNTPIWSQFYEYVEDGELLMRYGRNDYDLNTGDLENSEEDVYERDEFGEPTGTKHYTNGVLNHYTEYSEITDTVQK